MDVLIAGDDEAATQAVVDFAAAAGLNPVLVGPQRRAQQLKQAGLLHMLLSANDRLPAYQWNSALKIVPGAETSRLQLGHIPLEATGSEGRHGHS